jgi:hypothetical protein
MKQIWLPVFDHPDSDPAPASPDAPPPASPERLPVPASPGQIELFSVFTERVGEMYLQLEAGDFEKAEASRRTLIGMEGASKDTRRLGFLEHWATPAAWAREPAEILDSWLQLDTTLARNGDVPLRRMVRAAIISRLLRTTDARALASASPAYIPAIVNVLLEADRRDSPEHGAQAPALVRDALVAGRALAPADFEDDRLADLLAEDLEPAWLASVGALRGLWACPPAGDDDIDTVRLVAASPPRPPGGSSGDDSRAATLFWAALKVAADRRQDESLRADARRCLKRLDPALHAIVMRMSWAR